MIVREDGASRISNQTPSVGCFSEQYTFTEVINAPSSLFGAVTLNEYAIQTVDQPQSVFGFHTQTQFDPLLSSVASRGAHLSTKMGGIPSRRGITVGGSIVGGIVGSCYLRMQGVTAIETISA